VQLAPTSAPALDTLGVLLVAKGDVTKGMELLAKAVALAPNRPDIRFNYAKALMKAGRQEEARKEFADLQALKEDFTGKSEIPAFLK